MEFVTIKTDSRHSGALGQPGFDILRAVIGARQAALPTVVAIASPASTSPCDRLQKRTMSLALLAGHGVGTAGMGGRFSDRYVAVGACSIQGEADA
jgi:hypothetical protein